MRVAVVSDIHANLPALDAVLGAIGSVDAIWQLGDVVGYGAEPDAVVDRLRVTGVTGVRGNHDAAALGGREIEWFNPEARAAMEWTRNTIAASTRAWLAELPERRTEGDALLVHASPRDPTWEYVTSVPIARANLAHLHELDARLGLHGHTHVPVAFVATAKGVETIMPADGASLDLAGRSALLNPGSVGQPRDGLPTASWLVLETDADRATWHRVGYDVAAAARRIRAAGLPERLAARLAHGL
jgi:diadenosine tetraphosphatase ApaH/serine/threonine PP2A family protein phosphatase